MLLYVDPHALAVPLSSLRTTGRDPSGLVSVTDAGPQRIAAAIYNSDETELLCYISYPLPYETPPELVPNLQNAREYLGFVLQLCLLWHVRTVLQRPVNSVHWIGDNTSALSWVHGNKCKSPAAQFALLFVTWFQIKNKLRSTVEHREGIKMGDIDKLSRAFRHSLPPALEVLPASLPNLDELFQSCNVLEQQHSLADHRTVMRRVVAAVERFSMP